MKKANISDENKRLKPTHDTSRKLWIESGGYCCVDMKPLITEEGKYIGDIAHIEAASKKGARFNENQTREERREESNLMLVCPTCHRRIDKAESIFSVEELRTIKMNHREKIEGLMNSFIVLVGNNEVVKPKNLKRLHASFGYTDDESEKTVSEDIEELEELLSRLDQIPRNVRKYLNELIHQSEEGNGVYDSALSIKVALVNHLTNLSRKDQLDYYQILETKNLVYYDEEDESLKIQYSGRDIENWLAYLLKYSNYSKSSMEQLIVNLDFSLLDE